MTYIMALEDGSDQKLSSLIGSEPSKNSESSEVNSENKLFNPFTNAGALCVAAHIKGEGSIEISF
jgi:glutaminase